MPPGLRALLRQFLHDRQHSRVKSIHVRAVVARRGDRHKRRKLDPVPSGLQLRKKKRHVFADGFGKAGRRNADQRRMILRLYIQDPLAKNVGPAKDRAVLREIGRGNVHRLAKVADDIAPHIGGASLRTMKIWQRTLDAANGQRCAQRRAQFARIARCHEIRQRSLLRHNRKCTHAAHSSDR